MAAHTQTQENQVGSDVELELEVKKLETEVNEMAQKVIHYRTSLPGQLKSTLASILATQRPPFIESLSNSSSDLEPGPSDNANSDTGRPSELGNTALLETRNKENEKIALLKEKISINASRMLIVLKRMKDCMEKFDQLDSSEVMIHPAFKRKRTRES